MRVCDYIASRLYDHGVRHIYGLMGGGAAGLNDGFISHGQLKYVCFHHEQGAGHAATGEAKLTGKLAVVNPTTGCGGTNCITSVLNAWQDGVPVLFISGNVRKDQCSRWINERRITNIRKYGIQEHDIIETVRSMTKYCEFVTDPVLVPNILQRAIFHATTGRLGPVWIDIPADVQTAELPKIFHVDDNTHVLRQPNAAALKAALGVLDAAQRPVVLAGQGIKQSSTVAQFTEFVETRQIPVVSTYGARDLLPYSHPLNIGAIGIKGSRAGNFAMQASDALLILGCSLNTSHIGYDAGSWAPLATRIMVDIEEDEMHKGVVKLDHRISCDLSAFFLAARRNLE